jgi:hypothetical protein
LGLKENPNNGQHLLSFIEGINPAGREKKKDHYCISDTTFDIENFQQNGNEKIHRDKKEIRNWTSFLSF